MGKDNAKKVSAIYVRVSTDAQVEGYSIDAQIELVSSYLKSREITDFEIYKDPGFSGAYMDRPALKRLIEDVKSGKIDSIYVFKLDRLSRSQKDTLYLIEEIFNKYNVGFVSIREAFDTTTPFGKAMIGILSVFAQLERETIIERTRIGHKKRAEDGYWRGGGKIPFAYDYDKNNGILVINPERKKVFDLMKSLRLQGKSYPYIESVTGIEQAQIQTILNGKSNLGLIPYKGSYYKGRHEPVITEDEYNELMKIEESRRKAKRESHYLLSGKIYCGNCGAKYRYQKWGGRTICYCYSQQKSKPRTIKDPNCKNKRLDSYEIEDTFLKELFLMSLDSSKFDEVFGLTKTDVLKELENRLIDTQKQIDNLITFIADGLLNDDIKVKIETLSIERENILKEIKKETKNQSNRKKHERIYEDIKNLKKVWSHLELSEKKIVIDSVLDKIVVYNDTLKIFWKFES